MKKFSFLAVIMLLSVATFAQTWTVDPVHSRLGFKVLHMSISEFQGNYKIYEATITEGKSGIDGGSIEVTIDSKSINTDNEARDNHLRAEDFFDVAKYPKITYKSTSIKKTGEKTYVAEGDLTMKGVTKKVNLDIVLNGKTVNERNKKEVAGFTITSKFKRTDFNLASDMPEAMLANEVTLYATGEFNKN